jgi:hypothetical protein
LLAVVLGSNREDRHRFVIGITIRMLLYDAGVEITKVVYRQLRVCR